MIRRFDPDGAYQVKTPAIIEIAGVSSFLLMPLGELGNM
jgi:hypothetical protein